MSEATPTIGLVVHIEKTAGTSVRKALETAVGKRAVAVYHPAADRLSRSSDELRPKDKRKVDPIFKLFSHPLLEPWRPMLYPLTARVYDARVRLRYGELAIPKDTKLIFGHFAADKFDGLVQDPLRAVILREPYERMYSHFAHWHRNRGASDWRVKVPFDPNMTFQRFALLPEMQSYQSQALGGIPLTEFDVVGTTNDVGSYTTRLLGALSTAGICPPQPEVTVRRLNTASASGTSIAPADDLEYMRSFRAFHEADYAIYDQACKIAK
jgi:hypothetical protein